jgi:hypothetical protein
MRARAHPQVVASAVGMVRQTEGKKLGARLGGVKRTHALSTTAAAVLAGLVCCAPGLQSSQSHPSKWDDAESGQLRCDPSDIRTPV